MHLWFTSDDRRVFRDLAPPAPEPATPPTEYVVGLDLAQVHDFTAVSVVELRGAGDERTYGVRHLERLRRGTDYPDQVAHVAALLSQEPLRSAECTLVIDQTGIGRPVADLFRRAELAARLVGVTIHAGNEVSGDAAEGFAVPKRDLIAVAQVALQRQRLKIAPTLREATTLTRELADYRVSISQSGRDTYDARSGAHDDLVLSVCLALWFAERGRPAPVMFIA